MIRAAADQTAANMVPVGAELQDDLNRQPKPRDTGRLLRSLVTAPVGPLTLRAAIITPPQAIYGALLDRGTGLFGPHATPIVPRRAKVLSWVDKTTGDRAFARSVKGTGKHKGWWRRWMLTDARAAVVRGWKA